MKINSSSDRIRILSVSAMAGGFSLPEVLIVVAIFSLLVIATVSTQIFGLRLYRISETKLRTTSDARGALNRVRDEIRSGKRLYVGNGDSGTFNVPADNLPQVGNALRICPTTDTNIFVYYYVDPLNQRLNRMQSGSKNIQTVAQHFTNQFAFQLEDFQGSILTNTSPNNRVVKMSLQFYDRQFPLASATGAGLYDYYQLQTKIARRATD